MKIVFLSRYQNRMNRGAETFVMELSSRLSKLHDVQVLSGKDADSLGKVLSLKPDVVIPMNGRWQSLKVSLGRLIGRYKVVITGQSGIGRDDIINIALAKPDVFVVLTDLMAKWAKKWAWGSSIVKIPNGVDLAKFNPQGERMVFNLKSPIILSVGALVWYKHHEKVIEAVSKLSKGSLLIVGKGPEKPHLERLCQKLLLGRFEIISAEYSHLPKIYRSCDVFTLASWDREAFGIVYIEALASNLPVVGPDDSARQEIIGEGGILTNVSDSLKYSQAIKKALEIDWRDKPRKQAEKFAWDKVSKMYDNLFQELVKI